MTEKKYMMEMEIYQASKGDITMPKNFFDEGQLSMFSEVGPSAVSKPINGYFPSKKLLSLKLDQLQVCPDLPRCLIDQEELLELSYSLKKHGIFQPIAVKKDGDGFMVIIGQRRFLAAQLAGIESIPAAIIDGDPLEISLIDNIQRCNLTAIEEGEGLAKLKDKKGYSLEQLSTVFGKSKSTISEIISLNKLPAEIRDECRGDICIPKSILVAFARKKTQEEMIITFRAYRDKGLKRDAVRGVHRSKGPVGKQLTEALTSFGKKLVKFELEQMNDIKGPQRDKIKIELGIIEAKIKNLRVILEG